MHLQNLGIKRRKNECGSYIGCGMKLGRNVSERLWVLFAILLLCLLTNMQAATFDLVAQHEKIEAFTSRLEARRSPALWPNTLAAKFKADMQDKIRAEQKTKQQPQSQQISSADRKTNWTTV